jgi:hypothetical protein
MTVEFYKDKVQKLQQEVDKQNETIKHLKNELSLCDEAINRADDVIDIGNKIISKGRTTATIPPIFREKSTNFNGILQDREKAIQKINKKNASNE